MQYFLLGGFFIWPILIESVLGLWVLIERLIYVSTVLPKTRAALARMVDGLSAGTFPEAARRLGEFGEVVATAWREKTLNLSLLEIHGAALVKRVEKYLVVLSIVAQSAPLFGLLGTVTGMIRVFMTIESQTALGLPVSPSSLAGGIWEALLTTAAGLIVAIPALIAFLAFNRLADSFAGEMDGFISQIALKASQSGIEVVR